jgi:hypothetical protein
MINWAYAQGVIQYYRGAGIWVNLRIFKSTVEGLYRSSFIAGPRYYRVLYPNNAVVRGSVSAPTYR